MYAKLKQKLRSRILAVLDRAVLDIWMKRRHVDFERVAYVQAAAESAQFFQEFMPMTPNQETGSALFDFVLECVTADGLWLTCLYANDGFGTAFTLSAATYELRSAGADRVPGNTDDLTS